MRFNSIAPFISIYSITSNEDLVELANDIIIKCVQPNTSIIGCTSEAIDILLLRRNIDVFCVRVRVDVCNCDNDQTHLYDMLTKFCKISRWNYRLV